MKHLISINRAERGKYGFTLPAFQRVSTSIKVNNCQQKSVYICLLTIIDAIMSEQYSIGHVKHTASLFIMKNSVYCPSFYNQCRSLLPRPSIVSPNPILFPGWYGG